VGRLKYRKKENIKKSVGAREGGMSVVVFAEEGK